MKQNDPLRIGSVNYGKMSGSSVTSTSQIDASKDVHITVSAGSGWPYGIPASAQVIARDKNGNAMVFNGSTFQLANVPANTDVRTIMPATQYQEVQAPAPAAAQSKTQIIEADIKKYILPVGAIIVVWYIFFRK